MRTRWFQVVTGLLLGVGVVLVAAPSATADAVSFSVPFTGEFVGDGGTHYCGRQQTGIGEPANATTGIGTALVRSAFWDPGSCVGTQPLGVDPLWLSARAYVFRDGTFCAGASEQYNTSYMSIWAVSAGPCGNPAGNQAFQAQGWAWLYNDSTNSKSTAGVQYSPTLTY